jgi:hypothetical protein
MPSSVVLDAGCGGGHKPLVLRTFFVAAALLACEPRGHWPPRPAEHPATRTELGVYELTVRAGSAEERSAFSDALAARGFAVVPHEPRKGHLEVILTHEGATLVATLRSDGWFVDEALGGDVGALADTLAVSQRVADFIRNSGLPQQQVVPEN